MQTLCLMPCQHIHTQIHLEALLLPDLVVPTLKYTLNFIPFPAINPVISGRIAASTVVLVVSLGERKKERKRRLE